MNVLTKIKLVVNKVKSLFNKDYIPLELDLELKYNLMIKTFSNDLLIKKKLIKEVNNYNKNISILGRYEAKEHLQKGIYLLYQEYVYKFVKEGSDAYEHNNHALMIEKYEQAIELNYDGSAPYNALLYYYKNKKDIINSIRIANKAKYVFENIVYIKRGDRKDKLEYYKKILEELENTTTNK